MKMKLLKITRKADDDDKDKILADLRKVLKEMDPLMAKLDSTIDRLKPVDTQEFHSRLAVFNKLTSNYYELGRK